MPPMPRLFTLLVLGFCLAAQAPSPEYLGAVEKVKGEMLRTDTIRGAVHLKLEMRHDPRIPAYLRVHGKPDIVYVLDRWRVRLLFLQEDRMVTFVRKSEERNAEVKGQKPIPRRFVARLGDDERYQLLGLRAANTLLPSEERFGTCFAVGTGLVLTAAHNVGDSKRVRIRWEDGATSSARVVELRPKRDLALLKVDRDDLHPLPLAEPGTTRMGDRVFTVGFPATRLLGHEAKFAEGTISGEMQGKDGRLLVTSVPTQAGNSGSPLVNEAGQVVGLLIGAASHGAFLRLTGQRPQNVNFAVPASALGSVVPEPAAATPAKNRRSAIERTRAAICFVEAPQP